MITIKKQQQKTQPTNQTGWLFKEEERAESFTAGMGREISTGTVHSCWMENEENKHVTIQEAKQPQARVIKGTVGNNWLTRTEK